MLLTSNAPTALLDAVYAVAWSPKHPDLVATGGGDDMAFIWRVRPGSAHWCCLTNTPASSNSMPVQIPSSFDISCRPGLCDQVGEDAFEESHGQTHELAGHTDSVVSVKFSASGELLATGGMDGAAICTDPSPTSS